jgi:hypothetical protein
VHPYDNEASGKPYGSQPYRPPYQPPGASPPPPPPPPASKRTKRWPFLIAGIVGVAVLFVVGVATRGPAEPTSASPGAGPTSAASTSVASVAAAPQPPSAPSPTPSPTPPPPSPPTVYEGTGDDVVTITKDPGVAVVDFECEQCSRNTIVQTDGREQLLVNSIGSYKGRHLIDVYDGSATTTVTIKATGSWKFTLSSGLTALPRASGPISGTGDDVVLIQGDTTKATITYRGERNFIIEVIGDRPDMAVNTIGSYEGTVPLDASAVVVITSSGEWTITPS